MISGFHPDPSICRVGDAFYLVTSSFEYFPGIPIFKSRDLVSWSQIGHCLTSTSQLDLSAAGPSQGLFAPTIRWHDGVFFMTTTNVSGGGHLIVHATDPTGPWSDPVWVDQSGIDPSLFFEDGTAYFQSNVEPDPGGEHQAEPDFTRGIQQCVIDPFTGERLGPSRFLWTGSGGSFPEAPHVFRRGDHYYLLVAEGGTERGHMVTIARSTSVWGPFESCPRNPVLSHRSTSSPIQSTGHADFVELADGSWWAVLLGTRPTGNWHHLGRETFLAPVTWDDDGWPSIGTDGVVPMVHERPSLPVHTYPPVPTRDDFDGLSLGPVWNTLRTPFTGYLSLQERPGWLVMNGTTATTSDPDCVFVGRRQQQRDCTATALLDPVNLARGGPDGEAGLIVRIDEDHHYELGVTGGDGDRHLVYRQRIGGLVVEDRSPCPDGPLELSVECDGELCTFFARGPDFDTTVQPSARTRYLSSEVAGGFTGVYIGLYATGTGTSAAWDWMSVAGN